MKLYRGFATVGGMNAVSSVLGFVRDVLIAAVLGASSVTDAFFVAFRVPNMFRRIFSEGAFSTAFIPLFTKRLYAGGERDALRFAADAFSALTVVMVAIVVLAEIAMPWLMLVLAPGFAEDPGKFQFAVLLTRIALPYLVFMSWVALYIGLLNAHGRFAIAALVPGLLNVGLIAVLLGLITMDSTDQEMAALSLVSAVTITGLLQFAIVAFAAWWAGLRLALRASRFTPEMKRLLHLAGPGMIAGGMMQITMFTATIFASLEERVISWLYYADRIFQLPIALIGVAVGVVLLPDLSHKLRAGDKDAVIASENHALEFSLMLALPAAVALFVASGPIVQVLFERGAFNAEDARVSAQLLSALAFGMPAFVLIKVLSPSFFAREDTKTPMVYALAAIASNVVLCFVLLSVLGGVGIAIATALAGWINVALLGAGLRARGEFALDRGCRRALFGIIAASVAMGLMLWGLAYLLRPYFDPAQGPLVQVGALALLIAGGLATYFVCGALAGAMKPRALLKDLLGR